MLSLKSAFFHPGIVLGQLSPFSMATGWMDKKNLT
jgi:hypothetical protein